jgi:hypothetical protein
MLAPVVAAACVLGVIAGAAGTSALAAPARVAASGVNPKTDTCRRVPAASGTQMRCVHVQLGVHLRLTAAQRALRERSLTRRLAVPAARARSSAGTAGPADTGGPPPQCNFALGGTAGTGYVAYPDRVTSCSDYTWLVTVEEEIFGMVRIIGTLQGEYFQWASYRKTSTTWTHGMIVATYKGTDLLAAGLPAEVGSTCVFADNCTAEPLEPFVAFFRPGSPLEFSWKEIDIGPSQTGPFQSVNAVDTFDSSLGADITWDTLVAGLVNQRIGGLVGRCDSVLRIGQIRGGCVDQHFIPTLEVSIAKYGASARSPGSPAAPSASR